MSATFITQEQLDDIDTCMSFISVGEREVRRFNTLLTLPPNLGATPVPLAQILDGQKQAALWRQRDYPGSYRSTHTILAEAVYFAHYLIPRLSALSSTNRTSPASIMSKIAPPPGPPPAFAFAPMTDCLQLFKYHMEWVIVAYGLAAYTQKNYDTMRENIARVLPRVIDFTSFHLHTAEAKRPPVVGLNAAREFSASARRHYTFGMSGMANLLGQQRRITTLLLDASQSFDGLEAFKSVVRFNAELAVIEVKLKQVQRYCSELLALRNT